MPWQLALTPEAYLERLGFDKAELEECNAFLGQFGLHLGMNADDLPEGDFPWCNEIFTLPDLAAAA